MEKPTTATYCPDCGSPLSEEAWGNGLCLKCLLELAGGSSLTSAATLGDRLADPSEAAD